MPAGIACSEAGTWGNPLSLAEGSDTPMAAWPVATTATREAIMGELIRPNKCRIT
jgi:hypothetical protein